MNVCTKKLTEILSHLLDVLNKESQKVEQDSNVLATYSMLWERMIKYARSGALYSIFGFYIHVSMGEYGAKMLKDEKLQALMIQYSKLLDHF